MSGSRESVSPVLFSSLSLYFPLGNSIQQHPTTSLSTMNLTPKTHTQQKPHYHNAITLRKRKYYMNSTRCHVWFICRKLVLLLNRHSPDLEVDVGLVRRVTLNGEVSKLKSLLQDTFRRGNQARHRHGDAQEVQWTLAVVTVHTSIITRWSDKKVKKNDNHTHSDLD